MTQRGEDFGLTLAARQTIGITGQQGREHLNRGLPAGRSGIP
jgi:hypothetical protein